jgi:cytochrome b6-f complex iron-sulfur subunit
MDATNDNANSKRRNFLRWTWTGLVLVLLAELAWMIAAFLRPRRRGDSATATLVTAGPLDDFPPGSVTAFPAGKFYLSRLADGGLLALHRECTHLGCTVPWSETERRFICPCHASSFDDHGRVLGAPATRPLDTLAVRVEHGIVRVDLSRRTRRVAFHASQVTRP